MVKRIKSFKTTNTYITTNYVYYYIKYKMIDL